MPADSSTPYDAWLKSGPWVSSAPTSTPAPQNTTPDPRRWLLTIDNAQCDLCKAPFPAEWPMGWIITIRVLATRHDTAFFCPNCFLAGIC